MSRVITQKDVQKNGPPNDTFQLQNKPITVFDTLNSPFNFAAQIATLKSAQKDFEPFYVMNADRVNELLDIWGQHLPRIHPYYSIKCNMDPVLLRLLALHTSSIGLNCTTPNELHMAREFVSQERIYCSNPCWTRCSIQHAFQNGVQLLNFDSEGDLHRILSNHPNADLLLQICVNPESEEPDALFGCSPEKGFALLKLASEIGLRCVGISFSIGIDCFCPSLFAKAVELSARLFRVGLAFGHQMNVLNIGGGFANPINDWQYSHFVELCSYINRQLKIHGFFKKNIQLMATPGQFFAGSVYSLITNVIAKRPIDAIYVTNNDLDAGHEAFLYQINDGYYGSFGCRIMPNCEPQCSPLFDDQNCSSVKNAYGTVIGPMGFEEPETDVVQTICHFRQLNVGDWLIWTGMGAYSLANRGAIEDLDEADNPAIFYFASRNNWNRIQRDDHFDGQQRGFDDGETESVGSCGEWTMQSEDEEEGNNRIDGQQGQGDVEKEDDEKDNFWMFGWPLHYNN